MASAAPCRTLHLAQVNPCVWDLKAGRAERARRRPTNGIRGCDDQKGHSRTQQQGRLPNTAATTHGRLPRWQPPYSIRSSQKPVSNPKIVRLRDVKICPDPAAADSKDLAFPASVRRSRVPGQTQTRHLGPNVNLTDYKTRGAPREETLMWLLQQLPCIFRCIGDWNWCPGQKLQL